MAGSLPPSSRTTGREPRGAAGHDGPAGGHAAGERDHVHARVGHERLAQPGPGPLTALTTPGGRRLGQGRGHGQHRPGQVGGAFTTTVLPVSSAGRTLLPRTDDGPVEGQHRGHHAVGHALDRPACPACGRGSRASATSGAKAPAIAPMVPASNCASHSTLPCSRVSSAAVASRSRAASAAGHRRP